MVTGRNSLISRSFCKNECVIQRLLHWLICLSFCFSKVDIGSVYTLKGKEVREAVPVCQWANEMSLLLLKHTHTLAYILTRHRSRMCSVGVRLPSLCLWVYLFPNTRLFSHCHTRLGPLCVCAQLFCTISDNVVILTPAFTWAWVLISLIQ